MDTISPDQVRCPTCRAVQVWSDQCRRCRSDLRLLRAACSTYQHHRGCCFLELDAGHLQVALGHALRCYDLQPGPDSLRLLSLCALAREEWKTALELMQAAERRESIDRDSAANRTTSSARPRAERAERAYSCSTRG
ncbi:MAG: hypothetical protein ACP5XB_27685 [Isosphaeraceae bacterium]